MQSTWPYLANTCEISVCTELHLVLLPSLVNTCKAAHMQRKSKLFKVLSYSKDTVLRVHHHVSPRGKSGYL